MTDQLGSVRRLAVKALVSFVATAVVMSAVGSGVAVAEFEDVEGVHAPAVAALEGLGVFEGTACGEGLFCPGEPVRRWTMAVWLVRVLDESEPQAGSSRFVDVDDSEWWMPYVERLADLGITYGCATELARFCPEDPVTRAQMASFLSRAFGLEAPEGPPEVEFSDVGEGVHTDSIYALAASGITAGCAAEPEARFCPGRFTTRAQMASFLERAYSAYVGPGPTEAEPEPSGGGGSGGGGSGGGGVGRGAVTTTTVTPTAVTVRFGAASYMATEGGATATVQVILSAAPERTVTVPLTVTRSGGAATADYTRIPASVTFLSGQRIATFTVTAIDDSVDDDDESITVGFGTLSEGVTAASPRTAQVLLVDNDDPPVTVRFGAASYMATEGGATATVQVALSGASQHDVSVPLVVTEADRATADDYMLSATSVTFEAGNTSATFSVTAVDDSHYDGDESITIGFGELSAGVIAASPRAARVSLVDNDDPPEITVSFGAASYDATEGGSAATVMVVLSADPGRTISVPVKVTDRTDTAESDYRLSTTSVTFEAGDTSAALTVTADDDSDDDDGESITLGFGTPLPPGLSSAAPSSAEVSLVDNDWPRRTIRFGDDFFAVTEGDAATMIDVTLSAAPGRSVTVPLRAWHRSGATSADYTELPVLTFAADQTTATFSIAAVDDEVSDDGETIVIGFGNLPSGIRTGHPSAMLVSLVDNDDPLPGAFVRSPALDIHPLIGPGAPARERYTEPRDLWSDGETLWLLSDRITEYVYAYDLVTGARLRDRDIPIAKNSCVGQFCNLIPHPWGLWSDGEIMRVVDRTRDEIFAFDLATGVHRNALRISLSGIRSAAGMWSDGEIVWVSDYFWDKIFAYELEGGARRSDRDIDTLKSSGVQHPTSLWSDGVTMWVIDDHDDKIYAFDLATEARKPDLDFATMAAAGNHNLHGMWSNSVTMWVTDHNDGRVYAYNMPVTSALKSLSATDADFGLFQPGTANYEATVAAGTTSTTVTAQAAFSDSTVAVSYVGADMSTGTGATVPLTEGENTITITSTNGDSTHTYTLSVTVPAS